MYRIYDNRKGKVYLSNDRSATLFQTTDKPVASTSINQKQPFKLVHIVPPNEKRISIPIVESRSRPQPCNKHKSLLSTNQIRDEAMIIEDEAIVSIVIASATSITIKESKTTTSTVIFKSTLAQSLGDPTQVVAATDSTRHGDPIMAVYVSDPVRETQTPLINANLTAFRPSKTSRDESSEVPLLVGVLNETKQGGSQVLQQGN